MSFQICMIFFCGTQNTIFNTVNNTCSFFQKITVKMLQWKPVNWLTVICPNLYGELILHWIIFHFYYKFCGKTENGKVSRSLHMMHDCVKFVCLVIVYCIILMLCVTLMEFYLVHCFYMSICFGPLSRNSDSSCGFQLYHQYYYGGY